MSAWRSERGEDSLPGMFRSVSVPAGASFWRRLFAFVGPGYLVAVGYMDPGNWATDLAGGSALRVRPPQRGVGLQPGGDPAAGPGGEARHRYGARPRPGVPRPLPPPRRPGALGAVRGRHRRLRPGGGDRQRHRPEPSIRLAAGSWGAADQRRRAADPGAAARRLPLAGGVRHRAPDHHRRLFRGGADPGPARYRRGGAGLYSQGRDHQGPRPALHRHRHPGRHGDAPQPLPAQRHRADPRLRTERGRQA